VRELAFCHGQWIVLRGYSVFDARDARVGVARMLPRGALRIRQPLATGGRGQTFDEFDALLEKLPQNEMASYGIVIEENLRFGS
jgi:uncharacterized protein DUF3182